MTDQTQALPADASRDAQAAEAAILAHLDALGIPYEIHRHEPVFSVEQSRALIESQPGAHCKNLFLKESKAGHWLAVCEAERAIRIPDLARAVGVRRFSFGSPEMMTALLGVTPGSVTSLGLFNDVGRQVRLVLDAQMMAAEVLNLHPLHNAATVAIPTADLRRFFAATGHEPLEVDFDALEALAAAARAEAKADGQAG